MTKIRKVPKLIGMAPEMIDRIEEIAEQEGVKSTSEAVRRLLALGIGEYEKLRAEAEKAKAVEEEATCEPTP